MNSNYLDDLLYWIEERESILMKRKLAVHPPWTADPILANNRFCNVHREDDKVTKYIWKWSNLETAKPRPHLQMALTIARMVNLPATLYELSYPFEGWNPEYRQHFLEVFDQLRKEGKKAWTGAYMVTGGFSKGGETKEAIIARVLDGAAERPRVVPGDSLCSAAEKIKTPGIGDFLAAQIVADLKHSSILKEAPDWWTWCAPGPGSTMGLNFLHDRPRTRSIPPGQFMTEVNEIRQFIYDKLELALDAQNTQNCLCELSKYIRASEFGERLKNTYHADPDSR